MLSHYGAEIVLFITPPKVNTIPQDDSLACFVLLTWKKRYYPRL